MQILLALIPLLAYFCIFVYLKNRYPADPTRRVIVQSAILIGCYLVLSMEVLSIFKWITVVGLLITWLVPCALFVFWYRRKKSLEGEAIDLPPIRFPNSWWNRFILVLICAILAITAVVAWVTPPQTWDSLTYHMSRVAHWAQERSIWHFATGIDRQTSMPPGAEETDPDFVCLNTKRSPGSLSRVDGYVGQPDRGIAYCVLPWSEIKRSMAGGRVRRHDTHGYRRSFQHDQ